MLITDSLTEETPLQLENYVTAFVYHYQDCMNSWRELLLKDSKHMFKSKAKARKRKGPVAGRIGKGCKRAKRSTAEPDPIAPGHDVVQPLQVKSEKVYEEGFEVERGR